MLLLLKCFGSVTLCLLRRTGVGLGVGGCAASRRQGALLPARRRSGAEHTRFRARRGGCWDQVTMAARVLSACVRRLLPRSSAAAVPVPRAALGTLCPGRPRAQPPAFLPAVPPALRAGPAPCRRYSELPPLTLAVLKLYDKIDPEKASGGRAGGGGAGAGSGS